MTPFRTRVSQAPASSRDDRIDFLRGIALLIIFIDHVPKNWFEPFTLHAYAFCDAAEVFFFISGFVAALVYGRTMQKKGFVAAAKRVWRRAGVVYAAQLLLLVAVVALAGIFLAATGDQNFRWIFRVYWFFENPLPYIIPALTLHYQPAYSDILPCYVLLLAAFPLVLKGLDRNAWLVLGASFALWLSVQVFDLGLWTTAGERWFFNPFSWQFLFVLGAVFGHPALRGRMAWIDSPWLFKGAAVIAAVIAIVQASAELNTVLPWVPTLHPERLPLDKTALSPLRLVSFFALAVVVRLFLPPIGALSEHAASLAVIRCGRSSLQVFTFGALFSSLTVVSLILSGESRLIQSVVCLMGIAAQFVYAAWRDRRKEEAVSLVHAPMLAPVAVRSEARPHSGQPLDRQI
jgi:hypothetical protein